MPRPDALSILPVQPPLLKGAPRELKNPEREAILLAEVTMAEGLHIEVERLLAIADESVP